MLERVLITPLKLYLFHALQLKNMNIKLTNTNLFRNILAMYFPLKLIFFPVHIFSIRTFSLYQTKVIFAFMKI